MMSDMEPFADYCDLCSAAGKRQVLTEHRGNTEKREKQKESFCMMRVISRPLMPPPGCVHH